MGCKPGIEFEMSIDNHIVRRDLQRDARAWATFTGTSYTAALRQLQHPLARGILGEPLSARHLIATLSDHSIVGTHVGVTLGEHGIGSEYPFSVGGDDDFIELALIADMLRMFTITGSEKPGVGSYSLKHTAEWFLPPHVSYVSNGRLIWTAAALGLPISNPEPGSPNVVVGISEREHDYVRRMIGRGGDRPRVHHFRPAGFEHLRDSLERAAAGDEAEAEWEPATTGIEATPFHDWLILQGPRQDAVGRLARDYAEGVRDSDHRVAGTPGELLKILSEVTSSPSFLNAGEQVVGEWKDTIAPGATLRTGRTSEVSHDVEGYGAGPGDVERYEYLCPCGTGRVIEEHDNVPGFREHDVRIDCAQCDSEWQFVEGRSVRDWALERIPTSQTSGPSELMVDGAEPFSMTVFPFGDGWFVRLWGDDGSELDVSRIDWDGRGQFLEDGLDAVVRQIPAGYAYQGTAAWTEAEDGTWSVMLHPRRPL